jgi:serine/threonine protein kinase
VGPYVIERRLAQGGIGVLYLAHNAEGGRVVLKTVSPELATQAIRARLLREARALTLVDHPGVVRVHGTGEHESVPWIAMDLVQGIDLKRTLESGPLLVETALGFAAQAAEALVAAHDAGVIHRDLKPSNLLITPEGRVVVVDFGNAKPRVEARDGDILTSSHELLGTPAYLSPEQLEHGLADERSDIWALGCVLYEMVVCAPPFGKGGSATSAAILRDDPAFPPTVPNSIAHVVSACLRKSPFARVGSARELLSMLRDALETPRPDLSRAVAAVQSPSRIPSARPSTRSSAPPKSTTIPPRASSPAEATTSRPSSAPPRRISSWPPPPPSGSMWTGGSSTSLRAATVRGRTKGAALRPAIGWFAEAHGLRKMAHVIDVASPELRGMLRMGDPALGVMASGWYDTQLVGELLDLFEKTATAYPSGDFLSRVAEAIARDNVTGIYRSLFRLVSSPPLLEANAQRVWQTYFDEGTLAVRVRRRGLFEARVRNWPSHHPSVCRVVQTFLQHALRALGYDGLSVERLECVALGGPLCSFEGTWLA